MEPLLECCNTLSDSVAGRLAKVIINFSAFDAPRRRFLQANIRDIFIGFTSSPNEQVSHYSGLAVAKLSLPTKRSSHELIKTTDDQTEEKRMSPPHHTFERDAGTLSGVLTTTTITSAAIPRA